MSTETKTRKWASYPGRVGVHGVDTDDAARCVALVEVSDGAHERLKAVADAMSDGDARYWPGEVLRLLLSQRLHDLEIGRDAGMLCVIDSVCDEASEFGGGNPDPMAVADRMGLGLKPRGGMTGKRK